MKTSKRSFLVGILFALSISLVLVPISFALSIGVTEGDWAKYEITVQVSEGSEALLDELDLEDMDLDWFRIEVKSVSSDAVTLEITTRYLDGTEEKETVDARDVGFIVEANLKEGDPVIAPLIEEDTEIKGTITREYAGISRTVNYIEYIMMIDIINITYTSYFDKTTGIMTELSLSLSIEFLGEKMEASVTYKMTETNMFTPASITEQWWFYPAIIGIVVVVVVAIFVYQRGKRGVQPNTPSST